MELYFCIGSKMLSLVDKFPLSHGRKQIIFQVYYYYKLT